MAWAFAAVFLAATVHAFVPNAAAGVNALFVTNTARNLVHLVTARGFAVVALWSEKATICFMQAFGVIYMLAGEAGFAMLQSANQGHLLHVVHINWLANFLHVGLGVAIDAADWDWHAGQRPRQRGAAGAP